MNNRIQNYMDAFEELTEEDIESINLGRLAEENKRASKDKAEIELKESKASSNRTLFSAHHAILECDADRFMGSGIVVTLQAIGGKNICEPFMINNGLSQETIDALRADVKRSYDYNNELWKIK